MNTVRIPHTMCNDTTTTIVMFMSSEAFTNVVAIDTPNLIDLFLVWVSHEPLQVGSE